MLSLKKVCCVRLNTRKLIRSSLSLYIYYTLNFEIFQIFISKIHQSQHLRTRRDRIIWGKELQNQLAGDHLKWLVYCSDKKCGFRAPYLVPSCVLFNPVPPRAPHRAECLFRRLQDAGTPLFICRESLSHFPERSVFVFSAVSMRLANNRLTPSLDAPPQELNSTELVSLAGTAVGLEPISSALEADILTNWTITA